MSKYILISVESRKGGVGKTTAALNLGYLLKERYHVLLMDIDITGTSISALRDSRFWMNDAMLLEKNGTDINLLQFFTKNYLRGDDLLDFTINQEQGKVQVQEGVINVIASELFGEDANLLYDPSLLLENMHVFWLTRMISNMCDRFEKCFENEPCVIILDNSPGFVGIGKAVHNLMTDMGPDRAKFLTVSSLDIQDLESCLKSVYSLHKEYEDKFLGARYPETKSGDESFYAQVQFSGETEYLYYKDCCEREAAISYYQGFIINKVARNIIEGRTQYDHQRFMTEKLRRVFDSLCNGHIKDYQVPFDNVLLTQFYGLLDDKNRLEMPNKTTLKRRLNTIEGQVKMLDEIGARQLPYELLRRANNFDRTIDALKGALIASGYEIVASKFNPIWSPVEPLRQMIAALQEIGFTSESFELYVPRNNRMIREMDYFHSIATMAVTFADKTRQDCVWLASAVAAVACELSFCYSSKVIWNNARDWNDDAEADNKNRWTGIVNDALYDWMMAIAESFALYDGERKSLAAYVISQEASGADNSLREIFDNDEFVVQLKAAVSRLVDLGTDMRTLVNVIRTITIYNEGRYSLDVDFVPFLNKKIIEKQIDYYQAKERMNSELRDSDYMAGFREVLGRVIRNWGV